MKDLPKNFPEYSIMYKTILRKIKKLENETETVELEKDKRQIRIQRYQKELKKIKEMFPEGFFEKD